MPPFKHFLDIPCSFNATRHKGNRKCNKTIAISSSFLFYVKVCHIIPFRYVYHVFLMITYIAHINWVKINVQR